VPSSGVLGAFRSSALARSLGQFGAQRGRSCKLDEKATRRTPQSADFKARIARPNIAR
jgi:hypothetical protein